MIRTSTHDLGWKRYQMHQTELDMNTLTECLSTSEQHKVTVA